MSKNTNPEINPAKGVKRLNKLPLILTIGGGALIALIMMFGIMSKAKQKQTPVDEEEPSVTMDDEAVRNQMSKIDNIDISKAEVEKAKIAKADLADIEDENTPSSQAQIPNDAILKRLQALELANQKQSEELEKLKAKELEAVANAPLNVNLADFKKQYNDSSTGEQKQASQLEIAMKKAPRQTDSSGSATLLPLLHEDDEFVYDGIEKLDNEDIEAQNAAENSYRKRAEDGEVILPFKLQKPVSPFELKAGSIINATFVTGINSDLEGNIVAQVNANIFDSLTGDHLLIPQGTKVFGSYESENVLGVDRVGIVWNRLIYPNGTSLSIGEMRGSDVEGYSGVKDKVNNHYGRIFGSALLLSGVSASVAIVSDDDSNNNGRTSSAQTAKEEVSVNLGRVITEKLRKDISIEPTITIRPGKKSVILVAKDLTFEKPYKQTSNKKALPTRKTWSFDPTKGTPEPKIDYAK